MITLAWAIIFSTLVVCSQFDPDRETRSEHEKKGITTVFLIVIGMILINTILGR